MASSLHFLRPILGFLPEVGAPKIPPSFQEKLMWTGIALLIFFSMYHVTAVGLDPRYATSSDFLQVVTASKLGSLVTTGIGPIVLASIFLQLFMGAKLINVDMKNPEERTEFYGTQKLLAFILCLFEAWAYVVLGKMTVISLTLPLVGALAIPAVTLLVVLQIALGSIVLLYLDEVVSKYGIGSGISLFIAAGVALAILGGAIDIFSGDGGVFQIIHEGGAQVVANSILVLLPLFFTIAVFLVIVYVEGIRIEVPLAFERARGIGVGFPIKFTYVSNIPVILAFALIANFQLMAAMAVDQHVCITGVQVPQYLNQTDLATGQNALNPDYLATDACRDGNRSGIDLVNFIGRATGGNGEPAVFADGLFYLISPIYRPVGNNYAGYVTTLTTQTTPVFHIPEAVHIIVYIIFLMAICVVFGQFWVETTNMGPKEVAEQLDASGMQIPGFRRDPRMVASILEKYIPPIVVMGSAFVGLLAALADLTGALGTGTGILLTVGILYKMYQDIENQNVFASSALASGLLGK